MRFAASIILLAAFLLLGFDVSAFEVPERSETLAGYDRVSVEKRMSARRLGDLEGLWIYPEERMTFAVEQIPDDGGLPVYRIVVHAGICRSEEIAFVVLFVGRRAPLLGKTCGMRGDGYSRRCDSDTAPEIEISRFSQSDAISSFAIRGTSDLSANGKRKHRAGNAESVAGRR